MKGGPGKNKQDPTAKMNKGGVVKKRKGYNQGGMVTGRTGYNHGGLVKRAGIK